MNALFLVAKETYLRQVKSWSFVLMVFAPFLMLFFSLGIGYLSGSRLESGAETVALVSQDERVQSAFADQTGIDLEYSSQDSAQKALEEEKIVGYLVVTLTDGQLEATYHGSDLPATEVETGMKERLDELQNQLNIQQAQLTEQQVAALSQQVTYRVALEEGQGLEKIGKYIGFFGLLFLLYILTIIYASTTAQEVASEKGTKIMEVIFSSVPASTYFYGRILGIFMVIVTHFGIYALGGLVSYQFVGMAMVALQSNPIASAIFTALDWRIILFVLFGLVLIVVLSALCGSLVVRQEDVNKAVQPVMYPIILGFIGAVSFGQQAHEPLFIKIGSHIPLFSTFFMPIRLINGWVTDVEAWLSLLILVAATVAAIHFIGKSYASLILQTDDIGLWKSLKKSLSSK